jgi:hypothetical protein
MPRQGFFARRSASWSRLLVGFSVIYAAATALRYVLTMILRPEMRWLGGTIPIFFTLCLPGSSSGSAAITTKITADENKHLNHRRLFDLRCAHRSSWIFDTERAGRHE